MEKIEDFSIYNMILLKTIENYLLLINHYTTINIDEKLFISIYINLFFDVKEFFTILN